MVILNNLVQMVIILWVLSEVLLTIFVRAQRGVARSQDRVSFIILYGGIFLGVALAILLKSQKWAAINLNFYLLNAFALALLLAGIVVRATAILTLGRFFTTNLAVQTGQRVVRQGLYRWMRHPSYTGCLITVTGIGLCFGNWMSLAAAFLGIFIGYSVRILIEEAALRAHFGEEFEAHKKRTWAVLPPVW